MRERRRAYGLTLAIVDDDLDDGDASEEEGVSGEEEIVHTNLERSMEKEGTYGNVLMISINVLLLDGRNKEKRKVVARVEEESEEVVDLEVKGHASNRFGLPIQIDLQGAYKSVESWRMDVPEGRKTNSRP